MDSICTASRRILWICLSIISSAALAGSVERMNRFIWVVDGGCCRWMVDVVRCKLMYSVYCFSVIGVISVSISR